MSVARLSSYRCYYHPRPDAPAESGVLPFVQLKAADGEQAARFAHHVTDRPIDSVERIEVQS